MASKAKTSMITLAPLAALALVAGCGGDSGGGEADTAESPQVFWLGEQRRIEGVRQRTVGEGAEAAVLLWRSGAPPPEEAVVFLHGARSLPPATYGEWLAHLARRGNTIVYPAYQAEPEGTEAFLPHALAGIRAGLEDTEVDPDSLVAIGHVTGGPLAFDYAAVAEEEDLPVPRSVLAVYPSRNPPSGEIPAADLAAIDPGTLLAAVAGPGDPLPDGDAEARALLREATEVPPERRRFLEAPPPPALDPPRSVWAVADRLIAAAREDG